MIARGEIGFLISSLAEGAGIFSSGSENSSDSGSDMFLVVTWAIMLCTIIGPVCVGLLVKRVKRLQSESTRGRATGERLDVLGVWGVT